MSHQRKVLQELTLLVVIALAGLVFSFGSVWMLLSGSIRDPNISSFYYSPRSELWTQARDHSVTAGILGATAALVLYGLARSVLGPSDSSHQRAVIIIAALAVWLVGFAGTFFVIATIWAP